MDFISGGSKRRARADDSSPIRLVEPSFLLLSVVSAPWACIDFSYGCRPAPDISTSTKKVLVICPRPVLLVRPEMRLWWIIFSTTRKNSIPRVCFFRVDNFCEFVKISSWNLGRLAYMEFRWNGKWGWWKTKMLANWVFFWMFFILGNLRQRKISKNRDLMQFFFVEKKNGELAKVREPKNRVFWGIWGKEKWGNDQWLGKYFDLLQFSFYRQKTWRWHKFPNLEIEFFECFSFWGIWGNEKYRKFEIYCNFFYWEKNAEGVKVRGVSSFIVSVHSTLLHSSTRAAIKGVVLREFFDQFEEKNFSFRFFGNCFDFLK